jgi:hypothetical protein
VSLVSPNFNRPSSIIPRVISLISSTSTPGLGLGGRYEVEILVKPVVPPSSSDKAQNKMWPWTTHMNTTLAAEVPLTVPSVNRVTNNIGCEAGLRRSMSTFELFSRYLAAIALGLPLRVLLFLFVLTAESSTASASQMVFRGR